TLFGEIPLRGGGEDIFRKNKNKIDYPGANDNICGVIVSVWDSLLYRSRLKFWILKPFAGSARY
ncbi:MAG: hypothetical protein LBU23_09545, partial [Planctomycetota bacterium]|nr:hypothetical protein [Planctomycetota bacterium]